MKRSSYEQFAIVHADSAPLFNQQLNEEIRRLKDNGPVVHFSESIPFYAQIKYVIDEEAPETVAEASAVEGVRFVCAQCPYFKAPTKEDGTEDKRCKYGDCEHTELGRTFKNSAACEKLYELIAEGGIRICFTD